MLFEPLQYIVNLGKYTLYVARHVHCPLKQLKAAKLFFLKAKVELTEDCYRKNEEFVDNLYNQFYDDLQEYNWDNPCSRIDIDQQLKTELSPQYIAQQRKSKITLEEIERREREEIEPMGLRQQSVLQKIEEFSKQNNLPKLAA